MLLFWCFSTAIIFFIQFLIFNIDARYSYSIFRKSVRTIWVLYLILLLIPVINIIVCVISIIVFLVLFVLEKMDDNNLDGGDIIKIIFFIKDDK
jgi:hypothetical protein